MAAPRYEARWHTNSTAGAGQRQLSFDFWAYLFTKTYASTRRSLVRRALIGTPISATDGRNPDGFVPLRVFRSEVDVVFNLRNRCVHHAS